MEQGSKTAPGPTGAVPISIGIIAPCARYKHCKIPDTALGGQFILERMGHTYWIGTIFCLCCKHHNPADLFESKESDIVAPDPQAEKLVGIDATDIVKILGPQ